MPVKPKNSLKKRRLPKQRRSHLLLTQIRTDALGLIKEDPQNYTSGRIARDAGISIGSFYQYFTSIDSLTLDLIKQSQDVLIAKLGTLIAESKPKDFLGCLRRIVEHCVDYAILLRVFESTMGFESEGFRLQPTHKDFPRLMTGVISEMARTFLPKRPAAIVQSISIDCFAVVTGLVKVHTEIGTARNVLCEKVVQACLMQIQIYFGSGTLGKLR